MTLEENIKEAAKMGACKRWELDYWRTGLTIKRVEPVGEYWYGVYDEPDTKTEEKMLIERVGDDLHAFYGGGDEPLAVWHIQ